MKLGPSVRWSLGLVAAYAAGFAWIALGARDWLWDRMVPIEGTTGEIHAAERLHLLLVRVLTSGYSSALALTTILLPIAFVIRFLARARARAGYTDPFAGLRRVTAERPLLAHVFLAGAPLLWMLAIATRLGEHITMAYEGVSTSWLDFGLPAMLVAGVQLLVVRAGWNALIAPTVNEEEIAAAAKNADGLTFRAVAVTRETRATVAGLGVLSLAMIAASYSLPVAVLVRNPLFVTALLSYLALAIGGAVFFVRASRINVGLDGIYISGSARKRFVPYSEIDGAELAGGNIDLMRGARRVLRLQLHGEDALRRHALVDRIRGAIAKAEAERHEPAVAFIASSDVHRIERAASGAVNYREVTPTREKLWEMLESPAVDARGRAAAATALAKSSDDDERTRLRRAAERCAEPSVRARIAELLDDEEDARMTAHAAK